MLDTLDNLKNETHTRGGENPADANFERFARAAAAAAAARVSFAADAVADSNACTLVHMHISNARVKIWRRRGAARVRF